MLNNSIVHQMNKKIDFRIDSNLFPGFIIRTLFIVILIGCQKSESRQNCLDDINTLISVNPDSALNMLSDFNPDSLNANDRHYYSLLLVKAQDKAYIALKSDSLISEVIRFFSKDRNDPRYIEALYYGGRTASDMGDAPAALKYFHEVLEQTENNDKLRDLRGNVLSQTGRLLNRSTMKYSIKSSNCYRQILFLIPASVRFHITLIPAGGFVN